VSSRDRSETLSEVYVPSTGWEQPETEGWQEAGPPAPPEEDDESFVLVEVENDSDGSEFLPLAPKKPPPPLPPTAGPPTNVAPPKGKPAPPPLPVKMSFCVAGVALPDILTCLQAYRKSFCVAGARPNTFASFSEDALQFA